MRSLAFPLLLVLTAPTAIAQQLTLPAFTAYSHPDPRAAHRHDDGRVTDAHGELHYFVLLRTTRELHLRLEPTSAPPLTVTCTAHPEGLACRTTATDATTTTFAIATPGYHRLTVRTADGAPIPSLTALHLTGPAAADAHASTVERRNAASVHLGYAPPREHHDDVEWFYCELTPRTDPLWTYYMATGWHRGYFGMQVNSPTERRLIFSVWDSGDEPTDRGKVAAADRVTLVANGDGVHVSGFGNEGTGGHSHLVHDWRLGDTFRFLVHARPDGDATVYSGWFWFPERARWGLIASFRAPKDGGRLRGLYSFNENFAGDNGDARRECEFGNVWIGTTDGRWLPLCEATFTHDGHGDEQRLDRHAAVRGARFLLSNGGFTAPPDAAASRHGTRLAVPRAAGEPPDPKTLPTPPIAPRVR